MLISKKEQRAWSKERLSKLTQIREEGKWASFQIEKLKREMGPRELSGSSLSGDGGGGNRPPTIEQLLKYEAYTNYLETLQLQSIDEEHNIVMLIDRIEDITLRIILKRLYISGQRLRHIYKRITPSYETAKNWHAQALEEFYIKAHEI